MLTQAHLIKFFSPHFPSLTLYIKYMERGLRGMDRLVLFMLAGLLSGFALINIPLEGTFLASIIPVTDIIGILSF